EAKDEYNIRQPVDDVANYLAPWSELLQEKGGYSPDAARSAVMTMLPDILRYDRGQPARYPNGRGLTDDVYSARFAWLSNGQIGPAVLNPPDAPLAESPFLGLPNGLVLANAEIPRRHRRWFRDSQRARPRLDRAENRRVPRARRGGDGTGQAVPAKEAE